MSIEAQSSHVHTLGNGADIEYFIDDEAPTESGLLIYHHGTPAAGPLLRDLILAARASNLQAVELVRPGYGSSTRQPGRSIADIVPSVLELADASAIARTADRIAGERRPQIAARAKSSGRSR